MSLTSKKGDKKIQKDFVTYLKWNAFFRSVTLMRRKKVKPQNYYKEEHIFDLQKATIEFLIIHSLGDFYSKKNSINYCSNELSAVKFEDEEFLTKLQVARL